MEKKYQPISCDFYDELELLAIRKTVAEIIFLNEKNDPQKENTTIKNLFSKNKEEFLIMGNGLKIRLDQLVSVNGKILKNYC